jgi:argininosuccinate lyase
MNKLWQKNNVKLHPKIEAYTVGLDYILDDQLFLYDIQASLAHVLGLEKVKILSQKEVRLLTKAFSDIKKDWKKGKIKIKVADEDCHTVLENLLVKKLGDLGKKVHTGRSRNDQVLVAMRLFMKNNFAEIGDLMMELIEVLLIKSKKYLNVPFPGYSHTQQAMISSVGHYYASFVESLIDDFELLLKIKDQIDKNPLGSAAGFGVNLPLARNYTSKILGFKKTQINSLYCQNSKGKFESLYLEVIAQIMLTVGKLADDLIVFTSKEFSFFKVNDSMSTGSSIMPQKKNMDVLEIIRGNTNVVITNQLLIKDLNRNTFSGYNRDTQLIKKPLFESVAIVKSTLEVMKIFLENTEPDQEQILQKINSDILMADQALELSKKQGIPFRDAYKLATTIINSKKINYSAEIKKKTSLGSAGNLGLKYYEKRIKELRRAW